MPARAIICTVTALIFRTPTAFNHEAGQFRSVCIPSPGAVRPARRAYSISSSPEDSLKNGYELCIKIVLNGIGSTYLAKRVSSAQVRASV